MKLTKTIHHLGDSHNFEHIYTLIYIRGVRYKFAYVIYDDERPSIAIICR